MHLPFDEHKLQDVIQLVLDEAKARGADQAEASLSASLGLAVNVRQQAVETLEFLRDRTLGLTVFKNKAKGSVSLNDLEPSAIKQAVEAACNIAQYTQADEYAGLADSALMEGEWLDCDLYHPKDISPQEAIAQASRAEAAGLAVSGIQQSEGASFGANSGLYIYANSHGFLGSYRQSHYSLSCSMIANHQGAMERDYDYTVSRQADALIAAETIGANAAKKAIKRLNGRKIKTQRAPVLFDANIAPSFWSLLLNAIKGSHLYRKASFLVDHLGQRILPEFISLYERPHILSGLASAPFDNEGVCTFDKAIVENGVLTSYLLSSYSGRRLAMATTANAGGIHNIEVSLSKLQQAELLKKMDRGLIVTELMGQGVDLVTGDYSKGAAGFWVENGEIQYPVQEVTIAGNLKTLFAELVAVGQDWDPRSKIRTGSVLLADMKIAGL